MWWAGSEVQVYVTPGGAAARLPGQTAIVHLEAGSVSTALAAAFEAVKGHGSKIKRVRLWLGGAMARPFMLPAVAGLRDRGEALSMARAQAPQHAGFDAPCEVWLDAWQAGRECLAVVVERSLLDLVNAQADRYKLRLCAISPAWNAVLTQALVNHSSALLAVREEGALTLLKVSDQGAVRAAFANPSADRLAVYVQRTAIGWATSLEDVIQAQIQGLSALKPDADTCTDSEVFAVSWRRWADDEATVN